MGGEILWVFMSKQTTDPVSCQIFQKCKNYKLEESKTRKKRHSNLAKKTQNREYLKILKNASGTSLKKRIETFRKPQRKQKQKKIRSEQNFRFPRTIPRSPHSQAVSVGWGRVFSVVPILAPSAITPVPVSWMGTTPSSSPAGMRMGTKKSGCADSSPSNWHPLAQQKGWMDIIYSRCFTQLTVSFASVSIKGSQEGWGRFRYSHHSSISSSPSSLTSREWPYSPSGAQGRVILPRQLFLSKGGTRISGFLTLNHNNVCRGHKGSQSDGDNGDD